MLRHITSEVAPQFLFWRKKPMNRFRRIFLIGGVVGFLVLMYMSLCAINNSFLVDKVEEWETGSVSESNPTEMYKKIQEFISSPDRTCIVRKEGGHSHLLLLRQGDGYQLWSSIGLLRMNGSVYPINNLEHIKKDLQRHKWLYDADLHHPDTKEYSKCVSKWMRQ